jgi:hypothetical protein
MQVVGQVRERVSAGKALIRVRLATEARRVLRQEGHLKVIVKVRFLDATRRVVVTVHD